MIAAYWRTDRSLQGDDADLSALINNLAASLPVYSVPRGGIHAHTRHYMPIRDGKTEKPTLVFDAFIRLPDGATLVAIWPDTTLPSDLSDLASEIVGKLSYLGRSESWVDCTAIADWSGEPNCVPAQPDDVESSIEMLAALPPDTYEAQRLHLIAEESAHVQEKPGDRGAGRSVTDTAMAAFHTRGGVSTLPERLLDALRLETADYKECGWSRPPAARVVRYVLAADALPRLRPVRRAGTAAQSKASLPTVARYLLVGRPRPTIFDTVRIGELMRLAALSQFGWINTPDGERKPGAPWQISGRDSEGKPISDPSHPHAFWLPEDADGDGMIDHISVFVASGLPPEVQRRLERLRRLWLRRTGTDTDDARDHVADEWSLALEGFATPADFARAAPIFRTARTWESATPFIAPAHLGPAGHSGEIRRLLARRQFDTRLEMDLRDVEITELRVIRVAGSLRSPLHFHRFRSRRSERQFDTSGAFIRLSFPAEVRGPLAFGYGSHFGLGQLVPANDK